MTTMDFLSAALPWICIGLLLAIFFAQSTRKKKGKKKNENYGTEGMALGMCFGVAIGTSFGNTGIGRRLIETARDYAKYRGAAALYASCSSAEETIRFYMAMGFELSEHPITGCVKDEPFGIQMECRLI